MTFLDRIHACRRHDPAHFRAFTVGEEAIGHVKHEVAEALLAHPDVFRVDAWEVALVEDLAAPDARTEAVARAVADLRTRGWVEEARREPYAVVKAWGDAPLFLIDRSAVNAFGTASFGVHLNGFVRQADGIHLWVGRRSRQVRTAPGKLDHLVAGGQPHGLSLRENLVKECAEEAALPRGLAAQAVPTGAISYRLETRAGLKADTIFVYDLELPDDFVPHNTDGEVDAFELWPADRVMARVRDTDDFKFNVGPVLIDFFVRHGLLGPEAPDYLPILQALHAP